MTLATHIDGMPWRFHILWHNKKRYILRDPPPAPSLIIYRNVAIFDHFEQMADILQTLFSNIFCTKIAIFGQFFT